MFSPSAALHSRLSDMIDGGRIDTGDLLALRQIARAVLPLELQAQQAKAATAQVVPLQARASRLFGAA